MRRFGAGGWTWFSDPRAVYFEGRHRRTYFGWVNREGAIVVASYDHATRRLEKAVLQRGGRIDDHCNPALLMRADGRLTAFYCGHHGAHMFYRRTRHPEDVSRWGPEHTLPTNAAGHFGYTYPNPMYLTAERRTYLWWRGGSHWPCFSRHSDAGRWTPARNLLHIHGQRPYVKFHTDGVDTIHMAYTEGNPGSFNNSVYYLRFRADSVFHADGTRVAGLRGLPIAPSRGDKVYDVHVHADRAWVWDVAAHPDGRPVMVYATLGRERAYEYAEWTGESWQRRRIAQDVGRLPPAGYVPGISLDHEDPRVILLSRKAGNGFRVERWRTGDGGATWRRRTLSHAADGRDAIRPITPRGRAGERDVLWMQGDYRGFFDYRTEVLGRFGQTSANS
jgi:hypothetical protein